MKTNTILTFALLGSVALNGLLGGILLGSKDKPDYIAQTGQARGGPTGAIVGVLPPERRKELLRDTMSGSRGEMRESMRAVGEARQEVRELMMGEDFNSEALRAALSELHAREARLMEMTDDITIDILSQMTAEERKLAVEAKDRRRRGMRRGGQNRPEGRDERPRR